MSPLEITARVLPCVFIATVSTLAGCSYHRDFTAADVLAAVLCVGLVLRVARGGSRASIEPAEKPQADGPLPRRLPGAAPLLCGPCEEFVVVRERLRRGEITEHEALALLEGRHVAS
jgi:hypothetical protein